MDLEEAPHQFGRLSNRLPNTRNVLHATVSLYCLEVGHIGDAVLCVVLGIVALNLLDSGIVTSDHV